jgi:hypothetical protein
VNSTNGANSSMLFVSVSLYEAYLGQNAFTDKLTQLWGRYAKGIGILAISCVVWRRNAAFG